MTSTFSHVNYARRINYINKLNLPPSTTLRILRSASKSSNPTREIPSTTCPPCLKLKAALSRISTPTTRVRKCCRSSPRPTTKRYSVSPKRCNRRPQYLPVSGLHVVHRPALPQHALAFDSSENRQLLTVASVVINKLTGLCVPRCISEGSSGSLAKGEETCLRDCVNRFMDMQKLVMKQAEASHR